MIYQGCNTTYLLPLNCIHEATVLSASSFYSDNHWVQSLFPPKFFYAVFSNNHFLYRVFSLLRSLSMCIRLLTIHTTVVRGNLCWATLFGENRIYLYYYSYFPSSYFVRVRAAICKLKKKIMSSIFSQTFRDILRIFSNQIIGFSISNSVLHGS